MQTAAAGRQVWLGALGACCALLTGIGLARFAYTPLLPALIAADWFTAPEAAYLGAANLAGYFVGAMAARRLAERWSAPAALRGGMLVASISFLACAWPLGFGWFFVWRFLAGLTGAVLMVLAAPTALRHTPADRRGRVAGLVFTGVGAGIALSGVLVPAIVPQGLTTTWLVLAAAGALLTVAAWRTWPPARAPGSAAGAPPRSGRPTAPILLLLAAYFGDGLGFVPHTLFWVDYVARGLGQGLAVGGAHWVVFGLGASAGAMVVGLLADRLGLAAALLLAFLAKGLAVLLPLASSGTVALAVSGAIVGALTPGTSALVSARIAELLGPAQHQRVWGWMTTAFAAAQALGAYGFAFLFDRTGSYDLLFGLGGAALLLATGGVALSSRAARGRSQASRRR